MQKCINYLEQKNIYKRNVLFLLDRAREHNSQEFNNYCAEENILKVGIPPKS